MVIGGGALPQGLAEPALDRGIDIFAGYGMSETCPLLTLRNSNRAAETLESTSRSNLRMQDRLAGAPRRSAHRRRARCEDVPHDGKASGEIVVRAPWLTQGYLKNPEASEQLWAGGYLHTQDIASIDPHGYLQITDRIKDVIKSGGEWVSSLEIERPDLAASGRLRGRGDRHQGRKVGRTARWRSWS